MRRLLAAIALALVAQPALAAVEFAYDPGADLYLRIKTGATTSVAAELPELSSDAAGFYSAADGTLGLSTRGVYSFKIFAAATPSTSADDPLVGTGVIYWSGAACVSAEDYMLGAATTDFGSTTFGRALHNLRQAFGASTAGVYSIPSLANAPSGGGGGGGSAVDADVIDVSRTWIAQGRRASNVVEVNTVTDTVTLALKPQLNPNTSIVSVTEALVEGTGVLDDIETSGLEVDRSRTAAHFTVASLEVAGTYNVSVTVTTTDSQTIRTTGTLRVY